MLQPDLLLSGTRISGSFKCPRQSVLEERFGGDSNARAVEGTLLHDLLQACVSVQLAQSCHSFCPLVLSTAFPELLPEEA